VVLGGRVDLTCADLTLRPITGPEELQIFGRLSYALDGEIPGDLRAGRRRPEWMWIALQAERLVARAAWWSRGEQDRPLLLDVFDIDDSGVERDDAIEVGARLIETALADILPAGVRPPDYVRFVPPNWRDESAARHVVTDRITALERVGARLLVERLRLEWRPGTPLPAASGRLMFRPVRDRAELVRLMTLTLEGTLDAHSRAELRRKPPKQVAADQYDGEFNAYSSPRDWWRIATRLDGEPVGFVVPAHNGYNPIIAYIGVLPDHRGHGYVDEILAEGTRVLAANNAPRVRASTDLNNVPMANAFQRNGYAVFERQIDMTWDRP
jgi:RimJ/RimL family protein N-acetyltransferase